MTKLLVFSLASHIIAQEISSVDTAPVSGILNQDAPQGFWNFLDQNNAKEEAEASTDTVDIQPVVEDDEGQDQTFTKDEVNLVSEDLSDGITEGFWNYIKQEGEEEISKDVSSEDNKEEMDDYYSYESSIDSIEDLKPSKESILGDVRPSAEELVALNNFNTEELPVQEEIEKEEVSKELTEEKDEVPSKESSLGEPSYEPSYQPFQIPQPLSPLNYKYPVERYPESYTGYKRFRNQPGFWSGWDNRKVWFDNMRTSWNTKRQNWINTQQQMRPIYSSPKSTYKRPTFSWPKFSFPTYNWNWEAPGQDSRLMNDCPLGYVWSTWTSTCVQKVSYQRGYFN